MFTGPSNERSPYRSGSHYRMPWRQRLRSMASGLIQLALLMLLVFFAYQTLSIENWMFPALLFLLAVVLAVITLLPDLRNL